MPNNDSQNSPLPGGASSVPAPAQPTGIPMQPVQPAQTQPVQAPMAPAPITPLPQAPVAQAPAPITPLNPPVLAPMQAPAPITPLPQAPVAQAPVQPQIVRPQMPMQQQVQPQPMQQQAQPQPVRSTLPGQAPRPTQGPIVPAGKRLLTKDEIMMREAQRNKKILFGCLGSFGCATVILIILIFFFVGQAGTESSYLAKALGVNQQQLISSLILIVNLFFGAGALFTFIYSIVGIFKAMMARRDDNYTKKRGYVQAAGSFGMLVLIIVLWVSAWYYLNNQKLPDVATSTTTGIVTLPASTINLTAPIEITFDASKLAYDSKKFDIIMYNWDFGDGSSGPGTNIETHKYAKKGSGRYDVKLSLTFKNKTTGEESQEDLTQTVTIADEKVIAVLAADTLTGMAPLKVVFNGADSQDPDGQISEYAWEVDGGGFTAGEATFEKTFEQVGTYTVRLRVTNNKGDFDIAEKKVEVTAGEIPVAVIEVLNIDGGKYFVNKTYTFDGAKSSSPAGTISKYEWDFGDASQKIRTRTVQHSFAEAGTYKIVLTVTDEANKTAEDSVTMDIEVAPQSPDAVMKTVPAKADAKDNFIEGTAPFEVAFDATSSTDPDDNIVDYKWDFNGDGTSDAAGETTAWVLKDPGTYSVTLNVIDSTGFEGKSVLLVRVMSVGLVASIKAEPVSGVVPLTVAFDATGSAYSDGQIVSYEWDFGDGALPRSDVGNVTYKYTKIGNFTAKIKVRTNDNKEASTTMLISVRQVPLKSCYEASAILGPAPLTVTFNPQCGTGTIATYKWSFGDGENSTERKPSHVFANPGTYEVSLEVADAQNVVDVSSQFITVQGELAPQQ